jgi:hypothetical protein
MDATRQIARIVDLWGYLLRAPYGLEILAADYLDSDVRGQAADLGGACRVLARDPGLNDDHRRDIRGLAGEACGLVVWCTSVRRLDCGPLHNQVLRLKRYQDTLQRLQRAFPGAARRVVDAPRVV